MRRVAQNNQRLSVMSNYEQKNNNINGGGSTTTNSNTRGSQQFMNHNQAVTSGSQIIRQGKGKARQVNSMVGGKGEGGFNKSAEKTMTMVAKMDMKSYGPPTHH